MLTLILQNTGTRPKGHKLWFYWSLMARTRGPQWNNLGTLLPSSDITLLFCGPPKFHFSITQFGHYRSKWLSREGINNQYVLLVGKCMEIWVELTIVWKFIITMWSMGVNSVNHIYLLAKSKAMAFKCLCFFTNESVIHLHILTLWLTGNYFNFWESLL